MPTVQRIASPCRARRESSIPRKRSGVPPRTALPTTRSGSRAPVFPPKSRECFSPAWLLPAARTALSVDTVYRSSHPLPPRNLPAPRLRRDSAPPKSCQRSRPHACPSPAVRFSSADLVRFPQSTPASLTESLHHSTPPHPLAHPPVACSTGTRPRAPPFVVAHSGRATR